MQDKVKQLQEIIHNGNGKAIAPAAVASVPVTSIVSGPPVEIPEEKPTLTFIHEQKLLYKGRICNYYILGALSQDFSELPITLAVTEDSSNKRLRYKLDLYEKEECQQYAIEIGSLFQADDRAILNELTTLTELLEKYRDEQLEKQQGQYKLNKVLPPMFPTDEKAAIDFLSAPDLMQRIDSLLEQSGIQENLRLLLYTVGASYKSGVPLHIGIAGNSSVVKNLINLTGKCLPAEDVLLLTNVSARSLYHSTNGELVKKIMLLPNGVDKKAGQSLKQLQQGETIATATTVKDRLGNMRTMVEKVDCHFSSLVYVSSKEQYGHIITVSINDAIDQVVQYYNNKVAGLIDEKQELKAQELLQNIVRCIKPFQVINPYADRIILPLNEDAALQINMHYQTLVQQVCLLHQYQRNKDAQGRLIAQVEDMRVAADLLFSVMTMEGDELEDPALRKFYERVKSYVKKQVGDSKENYRFTMREIRQHLRLSKNYCFRYMGELQQLEYVKRIGYANRGFKYEVAYFDDVNKERTKMKDDLNKQLDELSRSKNKLMRRTPARHFRTPGSPESLDAKEIRPGGLQSGETFTYALNEDAPAYGKKPEKKNSK